MYNASKTIRSILWAHPCNAIIPAEQFVPPSLGARLHSRPCSSREMLLEMALHTKPDIVIFDTSLDGNNQWSQVISTLRLRTPLTSFIAIAREITSPLVKDLALGQVEGVVKADRLHLELPHSLISAQKEESFLTPQAIKMLCSLLKSESKLGGKEEDNGLLRTLTNREIEVLACLTEGLNYKSIARQLFVSDSTVKTHVNNIFTKLNVNDRTQAVLYGLKHGIQGMAPEILDHLQNHSPRNAGEDAEFAPPGARIGLREPSLAL